MRFTVVVGMRHEERIEIMKEGHKALFDRLHKHSVELERLPEGVDREKLEKAYDRIDNEYEWVLKKRPEPRV
jgi:hypothetical protein